MEQGIKDLIEISHFYGRNKEYVIAGGGNTSYKNDKYLWIKASGIALADIGEDGFVRLSRERLKVIPAKEYSRNPDEREAQVKEDLAAAVDAADGKRPSVETSMHDVISYPFIIHTHPTVVNALSCSKDAAAWTKKILGDEVLFIGYTDPGYVLFKRVADEIQTFKRNKGYDPEIILLENHGIFVSADTIKEVKDIYAGIEQKILKHIGEKLPEEITVSFFDDRFESLKTIYRKEENVVIKALTNTLITGFVKDGKSFFAVETAFTPDHIVYCRSKYLFLEEFDESKTGEQINNFQAQTGFLPRIIGLKNKGLLIIGESDRSADTIFELIMNMMKISWLAEKLGGSKPMTPEQIAFIESWEVENYRKKMAKN
jgi:rhamnose utilization protein RhaD (predicted bifunctional aldolase and dehydrogenase)